MRLTTFWQRMERRFGRAYADSFARDVVLGGLGGRTVHQALDAGVPVADVWAAVCDAAEIPTSERH